MILTKTPLRISFFGGGSDMPEYYNNFAHGAVLSVSIDKYMYIAINKTPNRGVKVSYEKVEQVENTEDIRHDRVRNALKHFSINTGIEISSFCEMPTKGTGLGSSSTYTVGLIKALDTATDSKMSKFSIAELAYHIERVMCEEKLGKQDQYAASFGGLNFIEFFDDEKVAVTPIHTEEKIINDLKNNLLMVFTGTRRTASDILKVQSENVLSDEKVKTTQHKMVALAHEAKIHLCSGNLDSFGELMHSNWLLKKELTSNISNPAIDEIYEQAMKAGATGGKILGAGGGGFFLFYVKPKHRPKVISKLQHLELFDNFNFTEQGTTVVYNDNTTNF